MKEIEAPINTYKREILRMIRQFWKSEDWKMWRALYTFIKYRTENERKKCDKWQ